MQGERRPSKKLSIPPIPEDARLRSGVAPLGETPRTAGEAQAGRTSVDRSDPRSQSLTVPVLPMPVFEAAPALDISLGPDWDDEDLSTRVFDRPPELVAALAQCEVSPEQDAEIPATPRVTQLELEQVREQLEREAPRGRAFALLRWVLERRSRLRKFLLVSGVLAGFTLLGLHADVPQLLNRCLSALRAWQATDDGKLRSVQGR